MTEPQITLHGSELSGHAHRVELLLLLRALNLHDREVCARLRRIEKIAGFKPMPASPLSLPT
jgi:glutathione S-transferase